MNSLDYLFGLDTFNVEDSQVEDVQKSETYISGYASLPNTDRDGEKILKDGIKFDKFLKYGYVNYQHSHEPEDIVGVPVSANVDSKGLKVVIKMLHVPRAKALVNLIKEGQRIGKPLVGFSVEGKVVEKDPVENNVLKQVDVSWVALTADPINPETPKTLKTFVKSITFFPKNIRDEKLPITKQDTEAKNAVEEVNKNITKDTLKCESTENVDESINKSEEDTGTNTNTSSSSTDTSKSIKDTKDLNKDVSGIPFDTQNNETVDNSTNFEASDNSNLYSSIPIPLLEAVINYNDSTPEVPLKKILLVIKDNLGFINLWSTIVAFRKECPKVVEDQDISNFILALLTKDVFLSQDPRTDLGTVPQLEKQDLTEMPIKEVPDMNQLGQKRPINKVRNILEILANEKGITEYKGSLSKAIDKISSSAKKLLDEFTELTKNI